jgi:hypothetical protein
MGFLLSRLYPPREAAPLEIELLLLCAQHHLTSTQVNRLRSLVGAGIDWARFVQMALDQRVHPLVYWNLKAHTQDLVPTAHFDAIEGHFFETTIFNMQAKRELVRLMRALQDAQIEAMPVRGPLLAYLLYDNLWLREFKDNDILVHEKDFEAAEELLLSLGYEREGPVEDNAYNQKLFNTELNTEVELHWGMDSPFMPVEVGTEDYWHRSVIMMLDDLNVRTFNLDDLLLMLCFHGAKHRWHRLKWLCDISEYVRKYPNIDWEAMLEQAGQLRIRRIVLLNLWMAHILFETPLPVVVREQIERDQVHLPLGRYIQGWMFSQFENRFIDQVRGIVFFLAIREHTRDRLPSIRHAIQYPKSPLVKRALGLLRRGKRSTIYRFTATLLSLL